MFKKIAGIIAVLGMLVTTSCGYFETQEGKDMALQMAIKIVTARVMENNPDIADEVYDATKYVMAMDSVDVVADEVGRLVLERLDLSGLTYAEVDLLNNMVVIAQGALDKYLKDNGVDVKDERAYKLAMLVLSTINEVAQHYMEKAEAVK